MRKSIIVTGGGGFLGGHVATYFTLHGMAVITLFNKKLEETAAQIAKRDIQKKELHAQIAPEQQKYLTEFDGDVTNRDDMVRLFSEHKPDALVHAAALLVAPVLREKRKDESDEQYRIVLESYEAEKSRFIEVNEAKVLANCIADYQEINAHFYVLLMSTIYAFDPEKTPVTEEAARNPQLGNLYAQSKLAAEYYWQSKIINLAVVCPTQVIGSRQFTPAVLTKIAEIALFNFWKNLKLKNGEMNPIHVNNMVKFLHVLCLHSKTGLFCVNGDGAMTLGYATTLLQKAATTFLIGEGKTPYSIDIDHLSAFTPALKINDSKLVAFFKEKCPGVDPHEVIPFEQTAQEMIESLWHHGH